MADYKVRVDELQKEGKGLIAKRDEGTAFINQINVRLSEISGALKELDRLAKLEVKPEVKPETKEEVKK